MYIYSLVSYEHNWDSLIDKYKNGDELQTDVYL